VVLLLGFAFVGGAIWTLRTPIGSNAAQNAIPKIVLLDLAFESSPIGSDVYIVGSNEYLGRTPFRRKVEYRDDRSSFVVFRLAGYVETTKEVRPDFAGAVTLRPAPPAATAPKAPARPAPTPDPAVPPAVAPIVPAAPTGKTEAWDKEKPSKGHGKPHGKGKKTEAGDSFDMTAGKTPPSGPKASPFD
jgi:hypothetical protein